MPGDWRGAPLAGRRARVGCQSAPSSARFRPSALLAAGAFPDARLPDVEGLVKLVDRGAVETHDWSLTPDRHGGIAPEEKDKDFDFEEALLAIHIDIEGLNEEAGELAARSARYLEVLGT